MFRLRSSLLIILFIFPQLLWAESSLISCFESITEQALIENSLFPENTSYQKFMKTLRESALEYPENLVRVRIESAIALRRRYEAGVDDIFVPDQKKLFYSIIKDLEDAYTNSTLVSPTGTGKSRVMALEASVYYQQSDDFILMIVPNKDGVTEIKRGLGNVGIIPDSDIGSYYDEISETERAENLKKRVLIVVANSYINLMTGEGPAFDFTRYKRVIIDEIHRLTYDKIRWLIKYYQQFSSLIHVYTATDEWKEDGAFINVSGKLFGRREPTYKLSLLEAFNNGHPLLVPEIASSIIDARTIVPDKYKKIYEKILKHFGNQDESLRLLSLIRFHMNYVDSKEGFKSADRSSGWYVNTVSDAEFVKNLLNEVFKDYAKKGFPYAKVLTGETKADSRKDIIAELKKGDVKAAVSIDLLVHSVDIPRLQFMYPLRKISSLRTFFQALGRFARKFEGEFTKNCAFIIQASTQNFEEMSKLSQLDQLYFEAVFGTSNLVNRYYERGLDVRTVRSGSNSLAKKSDPELVDIVYMGGQSPLINYKRGKESYPRQVPSGSLVDDALLNYWLEAYKLDHSIVESFLEYLRINLDKLYSKAHYTLSISDQIFSVGSPYSINGELGLGIERRAVRVWVRNDKVLLERLTKALMELYEQELSSERVNLRKFVLASAPQGSLSGLNLENFLANQLQIFKYQAQDIISRVTSMLVNDFKRGKKSTTEAIGGNGFGLFYRGSQEKIWFDSNWLAENSEIFYLMYRKYLDKKTQWVEGAWKEGDLTKNQGILLTGGSEALQEKKINNFIILYKKVMNSRDYTRKKILIDLEQTGKLGLYRIEGKPFLWVKSDWKSIVVNRITDGASFKTTYSMKGMNEFIDWIRIHEYEDDSLSREIDEILSQFSDKETTENDSHLSKDDLVDNFLGAMKLENYFTRLGSLNQELYDYLAISSAFQEFGLMSLYPNIGWAIQSDTSFFFLESTPTFHFRTPLDYANVYREVHKKVEDFLLSRYWTNKLLTIEAFEIFGGKAIFQINGISGESIPYTHVRDTWKNLDLESDGVDEVSALVIDLMSAFNNSGQILNYELILEQGYFKKASFDLSLAEGIVSLTVSPENFFLSPNKKGEYELRFFLNIQGWKSNAKTEQPVKIPLPIPPAISAPVLEPEILPSQKSDSPSDDEDDEDDERKKLKPKPNLEPEQTITPDLDITNPEEKKEEGARSSSADTSSTSNLTRFWRRLMDIFFNRKK